ncbi:hypothetical protein BB561_002691 [Smittium simulii]|uniref:Uncharacterized protein n=1 Tax=Smittium simulii TaxID=133385 RepID=A0A2T9YPV0_9FUNG|nr:hypothetical protein BB561_002691 [Smittium simulii]
MSNENEIDCDILLLWRLIEMDRFKDLVFWTKHSYVTGGLDYLIYNHRVHFQNLDLSSPQANQTLQNSNNTSDIKSREMKRLVTLQTWPFEYTVYPRHGFMLLNQKSNTVSFFHHLFQPFAPNLLYITFPKQQHHENSDYRQIQLLLTSLQGNLYDFEIKSSSDDEKIRKKARL